MPVDRRYFVDVFGSVVDAVRADYTSITTPPDNDQPFYMYGHILDILKRLGKKDASSSLKYKKYPLIALVQDFEEVKDGWSKYEYKLPEIKVIIVTGTSPNYDSSYRYTNTFKPTLYPLWDLLLSKIAESDHIDVQDVDHIKYSKYDRVFWGTEQVFGVESNIFNDYLDAIEIRFKDLEIFKHSNC